MHGATVKIKKKSSTCVPEEQCITELRLRTITSTPVTNHFHSIIYNTAICLANTTLFTFKTRKH
jgi:hypothetical protein